TVTQVARPGGSGTDFLYSFTVTWPTAPGHVALVEPALYVDPTTNCKFRSDRDAGRPSRRERHRFPLQLHRHVADRTGPRRARRARALRGPHHQLQVPISLATLRLRRHAVSDAKARPSSSRRSP